MAGVLCGETLPGDTEERNALYSAIKEHGFGLYMPDGSQYKAMGPSTRFRPCIPIPMLKGKASNPLQRVMRAAKGTARTLGIWR